MELARLFALVTLREPQSRINVLALPTLPTTPLQVIRPYPTLPTRPTTPLQVMDLTAGPPAMSPCCWPSYSHLPPPPSAGDGAQGSW